MWLFDLFDDSPGWVKSRRKRHKMIEQLVIDNVPNIAIMPEYYVFVYDKPMKVEYNKIYKFNNNDIIQTIKYNLAVKRFAGVGDAVGICLGYYRTEITPNKTCNGYDFENPHITKDFEYFFQGNELEIWKKELSEQLPEFFKCCNVDIKQKLHDHKAEKEVKKELCNQSIDRTSHIIEYLRSKL